MSSQAFEKLKNYRSAVEMREGRTQRRERIRRNTILFN